MSCCFFVAGIEPSTPNQEADILPSNNTGRCTYWCEKRIIIDTRNILYIVGNYNNGYMYTMFKSESNAYSQAYKFQCIVIFNNNLCNNGENLIFTLKLTCHHINRRHFCFNIKSISVHLLLWMNVMLDFICMVFAGM